MYSVIIIFFFGSFFCEFFNARIKALPFLSPDNLYCDFNYWRSFFKQNMKILWEKVHCVPSKKLPSEIFDMLFPYLLLALSDY